jgi:hypothetical protein
VSVDGCLEGGLAVSIERDISLGDCFTLRQPPSYFQTTLAALRIASTGSFLFLQNDHSSWSIIGQINNLYG